MNIAVFLKHREAEIRMFYEMFQVFQNINIEKIDINIAKGTTDPRVEFILLK